MDKKVKLLLILHHSPPIHGASKVGDIILNSKEIASHFDTRFIKIKSSDGIENIGKFGISKILKSVTLFFNVFFLLCSFRPQKIYFTVSPFGFAFYRDLIISIPIKCYCFFKNCDVFYHYHASGIKNFTASSKGNLRATNFFMKGVNIILISKLMLSELSLVKSYKQVVYLNNGVEDNLNDKEFYGIIENREKSKSINVLYLSNMILEKGYDTVLNLAKLIKHVNKDYIKFHFAGGWSSAKDEVFFKAFVKENQLENIVFYHGLVTGDKKKELFVKANMFIFPSRYKKEVFPLSVLEALSYGIPVLAFNAGAISQIIDEDIGLITNKDSISNDFNTFENQYLVEKKYLACRRAYLEKFTINVFEKKLASILKN